MVIDHRAHNQHKPTKTDGQGDTSLCSKNTAVRKYTNDYNKF